MREGGYLGSAIQGQPSEKYDTCNKTAPVGEIERELNSIDSILETLERQTAGLNGRLRIVLHPESPSTGAASGPSPTPGVPLAAGLSAFRIKLSYLSQRLDTLTNRIDL